MHPSQYFALRSMHSGAESCREGEDVLSCSGVYETAVCPGRYGSLVPQGLGGIQVSLFRGTRLLIASRSSRVTKYRAMMKVRTARPMARQRYLVTTRLRARLAAKTRVLTRTNRANHRQSMLILMKRCTK